MSDNTNPMSAVSPRHFPDMPVHRPEHQEGAVARLIEQQTAKVPSDWFLVAALAAMCASLAFDVRGNVRLSRFVGMWPTPLLTMGLYNKIVKMLGPR
jgi:hypothetical protein